MKYDPELDQLRNVPSAIKKLISQAKLFSSNIVGDIFISFTLTDHLLAVSHGLLPSVSTVIL